MDIWEKLYLSAKPLYKPQEINDFVYANNVVCALESKSGKVYTGYCIEMACGTINLCAERVALLNMLQDSGEMEVKRMIAFRDAPPTGLDGLPCGTCRETLMEFSPKNADTEIMVNYEKRETTTLKEIFPNWWGTIKTNKK
ncbi:hypothetical protein C5L30_001398 [Companilactobacillus farciminis]|uniref:CMP/dCMP-type deaminase domain-containing protein n=1 Tax=Companilactobacillus farciminis TaxID=1612 RepID=A0A4R5NCT7_9LACO|nr:cytidine deaminase [Companilactobacillus farciminis]ATO46377.1 cytidine deaminase [Companilactobacillus farciminis KCTC 3681 = DSM 20184]KRK61572.1 cytidine deaminase [Companilactobacillus farciminis KCTC 3681 = DSM 20184]TDG70607.1 hypothetical protein C5L30_001398 [Companilactobacillus farciminis]